MKNDKKTEGKNSNQTELIQFRCTPEIKNSLAKLAEKEGTDISKFVRKIATRLVTASERPKYHVTPTNEGVGTMNRNEWNKKELQELAISILCFLGLFLFVKLVIRFF